MAGRVLMVTSQSSIEYVNYLLSYPEYRCAQRVRLGWEGIFQLFRSLRRVELNGGVGLTGCRGRTIVRSSVGRGVRDEHSGDWRRRARACPGVETGAERRRAEDLVRPGECRHGARSGVRGGGRGKCAG